MAKRLDRQPRSLWWPVTVVLVVAAAAVLVFAAGRADSNDQTASDSGYRDDRKQPARADSSGVRRPRPDLAGREDVRQSST